MKLVDRTGCPRPTGRPKLTHSQILSLVRVEGECWEWVKCRNKAGYGVIRRDGRNQLVPRVVWEAENGRSLLKGECVCHVCDNPPCINPKHLFVGYARDNNLDKAQKSRGGRGKLTVEQVRGIRADSRSLSILAREYGVDLSTISLIKNGKRYRWVD